MGPKEMSIQWTCNAQARSPQNQDLPDYLCVEAMRKARDFHRSLPHYRPTPLVELRFLAKELGLGSIMVKDESERFGLQAFKVLGASFATAKILSEVCGFSGEVLPFSFLRQQVAKRCRDLCLATATDGNHGRALAWVARQLGVQAVVYLPRGCTAIRVEHIRQEGAQAVVVDGNYDQAVLLACEEAKRHGWLLIQDTGWPGYDQVPRWIMQGYGTLIDEVMEQSQKLGQAFTHVLLQAGVGSFAAAVQAYLFAHAGFSRPVSVVLEPIEADCLLQSLRGPDGRPQEVTGSLKTIMAGLACGRPNPMAWDVLSRLADCFAACGDGVAALGVRVSGNPVAGDPRLVSGESGAVGLGFLCSVMRQERFKDLRTALGLGPASRVLAISTEGNTDPDVYRSIVWDGLCPCLAADDPGKREPRSKTVDPEKVATESSC